MPQDRLKTFNPSVAIGCATFVGGILMFGMFVLFVMNPMMHMYYAYAPRR